MLKKLSLVALTGIVAGAGALGMTGAPAAADGLSIGLGVPGVFVQYDDYRYHHDREYRDRYDRWHEEQDRRDRRDRGDDHRDRGDRHHDDRDDHGH